MALTKISRSLLDTGVSDSSDATAITIDSSERVGIGTSTLHKNLNIHTSDSNSTNIVFTNSTTGTGSSDGFYVGIDSNESPEFWNYENTDFIVGLNNSEKFRIKADGNVGIGNTSPSNALTVGSTSVATSIISVVGSSSGFPQIRFSDDASESGQGRVFYDSANDGMGFSTGQSERMRITSSGNVGIGETGTVTHRLEVLSTVANYASGRIVNNTGSGSTEYGFISQLANDPNNTTNYLYLGGSSSTTRYIVYSNGNVANINNSYGAYSDVKLKENIVDANPQLEKIKQLQVRNFNLKAEPDKKLIGLVAQEAETIFPKLIDETEDTENDENGAIVKTGETTKSIKYSVFVPVLIKAIQELSAKVEELESKINE